MSVSSSGSGSDTTVDPQEAILPSRGSGKRKTVIDTRRAEQNRMAQRSFRLRRELHVKELENKVRDMEILKDRLERLELENERLKYRLWELESSPKAPSPDNQHHHHHHHHHLPPLDTSPSSYGSEEKDVSSPPHDPADKMHTGPSNHSRQPLDSIHYHAADSIPPILPPPSPSPSVFRPIPVAYWDKTGPRSNQHLHEPLPPLHSSDRVLDDLASILRTRQRPPIQHHKPMHT
ncbi:hypothetical protein [Absidia glauca]|uniref:BZIP domain-containing protein n=1 Tax=Absidia glauca TaxID=4829 RepID=A0A163KKP3_ABSGL|nr:hypothetical protein [Absidia glauca]